MLTYGDRSVAGIGDCSRSRLGAYGLCSESELSSLIGALMIAPNTG